MTELDRRETDARRAGVEEELLAGLEVADEMQGLEGREPLLGSARSAQVAKAATYIAAAWTWDSSDGLRVNIGPATATSSA